MNMPADAVRLIVLVSMILTSGCATVLDCRYQLGLTLRTQRAWSEFDSGHLLISDYSSHYGDGWKEGYCSVLAGGNGLPPVIPPRRYWDPSPLSLHAPGGQQDWLQGFLSGAARARQQSRHPNPQPFLWQSQHVSAVSGQTHLNLHALAVTSNSTTSNSVASNSVASNPVASNPVTDPEHVQAPDVSPPEKAPDQTSAVCTIRLLGIIPNPPGHASAGSAAQPDRSQDVPECDQHSIEFAPKLTLPAALEGFQ